MTGNRGAGRRDPGRGVGRHRHLGRGPRRRGVGAAVGVPGMDGARRAVAPDRHRAGAARRPGATAARRSCRRTSRTKSERATRRGWRPDARSRGRKSCEEFRRGHGAAHRAICGRGPSPASTRSVRARSARFPYREFMRVRVMDSWVHEQDIRVATGRPGHDSGPAAQLSIDRLCVGHAVRRGQAGGSARGSVGAVRVARVAAAAHRRRGARRSGQGGARASTGNRPRLSTWTSRSSGA